MDITGAHEGASTCSFLSAAKPLQRQGMSDRVAFVVVVGQLRPPHKSNNNSRLSCLQQECERLRGANYKNRIKLNWLRVGLRLKPFACKQCLRADSTIRYTSSGHDFAAKCLISVA
ncbi:MAG: hypothetical protein ICV68_06845 [Pyrinomonadaceae bacterium]|nr:hypothetical protein [Pyrinomonadaceae bacterium]